MTKKLWYVALGMMIATVMLQVVFYSSLNRNLKFFEKEI